MFIVWLIDFIWAILPATKYLFALHEKLENVNKKSVSSYISIFASVDYCIQLLHELWWIFVIVIFKIWWYLKVTLALMITIEQCSRVKPIFENWKCHFGEFPNQDSIFPNIWICIFTSVDCIIQKHYSYIFHCKFFKRLSYNGHRRSSECIPF